MAISSHLTTNFKPEPSIFELFAAELLDKICFAAFSKFFKYIDDEFSLKLNESGMLSSGLLGTLQFFYLEKYGASFGESFYGLQRSNIETPDKLISMKKKIASIILLILPQYLEGNYKTSFNPDSYVSKTATKLILLYNGIKTTQALAYMMHLVETHSPHLGILKLKLKYPAQQYNDDSSMFTLFKIFEIIAFFLQFVQWWYSNKRQKTLHSLRNPREVKTSNNEIKNICPICLQQFNTPTVNSITGLVYCWECISTQIASNKRCLVTNIPTNFKDLIRVFET